MVATAKRVGLIRRAWVSPECQDGRGLAASLLGADERTPVRYTAANFEPGEARSEHMHSEAIAVCVTRGRLTFWIGADFKERIDLAPGDYIRLPGMLRHRESAGQEGAELVIAHLAAFETVEVE
jgi:quercetin dioxygenase-like cupin family protein